VIAGITSKRPNLQKIGALLRVSVRRKFPWAWRSLRVACRLEKDRFFVNEFRDPSKFRILVNIRMPGPSD
jgi:hypothetical protein